MRANGGTRCAAWAFPDNTSGGTRYDKISCLGTGLKYGVEIKASSCVHERVQHHDESDHGHAQGHQQLPGPHYFPCVVPLLLLHAYPLCR